MNKDLLAILDYLEKEKGIKRELVISAIQKSLQVAARKSVHGASNVNVAINPKTGDIQVFCEKEIVDAVKIPAQQISLADARKLDPECEIGQFIDTIVTPENFGRIAAQKAGQIITQKLREAEKEVICEEYRDRLNQLVSGTVKKVMGGPHSTVIVSLEKVDAIMPSKEYPKSERYKPGEKILALLLSVNDAENGGAEVVISRNHPDFVKRLFEREVSELREGTIVIKKIVREPGYKTKMAVISMDSKIDPVGSCVGVRGNRVKSVLSELHKEGKEKIDIFAYSDDPLTLLVTALPTEIRKINLNEEEKTITFVVEDEKFSSVVGLGGANIRLLSQLVGYKLEAKSMSEYNDALRLEREEISDDATLNKPIYPIEGVNSLVFDLIVEKYKTIQSLLQATPEDLATIPGISLEKADNILEQVRKTEGIGIGKKS